jgi:ectoine hydroxylase-related dioxygenase (phytanoyl-CoA dioxygenase family)
MSEVLEGIIPKPTASVEQAQRDVADHGVAIITGILSPSELKVLYDAVYREAEADRRAGRADAPYFADALLGNPSQRVWDLPSRGHIFCELVEHPIVMKMVDEFIEGGVRLSTFSANITQPGSSTMVLHSDQGTNPRPWGPTPHGLNFIWCLDDFVEETGATRMVPGSHRLNRPATMEEMMNAPTVAVEAPAGSLIIMESRVWHKTGANTTSDRQRAAILGFYCMDCFMPNENWWLCLSPLVRKSGQDSLLKLMGFGSESPLGRVYGRPAN